MRIPLTDRDALTVFQIQKIYTSPEMGPIRDLYRRLASFQSGCSSCRRKELRPDVLAPSVGATLARIDRAGRSDELYEALAEYYSNEGPFDISIGPYKRLLEAPKRGKGNRNKDKDKPRPA